MDKRRVNVRGIIWQDGKILAVRHKNDDGSEASYWAIPGGGLDPRENLIDGVKRELLEETGIKTKVGKLLFIQQFAPSQLSNKKHHEEEFELFFAIDNPTDFDNIDLSQTSHGLDEISRIEFINPKSERVLPAFISDINISDYIEADLPVYLYNDF